VAVLQLLPELRPHGGRSRQIYSNGQHSAPVVHADRTSRGNRINAPAPSPAPRGGSSLCAGY
jgi:hypothetical protein